MIVCTYVDTRLENPEPCGKVASFTYTWPWQPPNNTGACCADHSTYVQSLATQLQTTVALVPIFDQPPLPPAVAPLAVSEAELDRMIDLKLRARQPDIDGLRVEIQGLRDEIADQLKTLQLQAELVQTLVTRVGDLENLAAFKNPA